jgi:hypothetical protein
MTGATHPDTTFGHATETNHKLRHGPGGLVNFANYRLMVGLIAELPTNSLTQTNRKPRQFLSIIALICHFVSDNFRLPLLITPETAPLEPRNTAL